MSVFDGGEHMEPRRRSIFKAISWRIIATTVTGTVALLVTGELAVAGAIGTMDAAIKLGAYYLHERAWLRVRFAQETEEIT